MQKQTALAGRKIRCILFDLGETLWTHINRDDEFARLATQHALQTIGEHVAPKVIAQVDPATFTKQFRLAVVLQARELVRHNLGYEPDYARAVNAALPQFGLPPLEDSVSYAIFEALRIPIWGSRRLFDDTLSTLQTLQQRGYVLGVVSNRYWGGQPFLADVQKMGLFDYFDPRTMAISADLGIRKPNPEIFHFTLKALGVSAEEAAMVGDSLYADVAGAKGLNMFAVWKPKLYQRAELQTLPAGTTAQNDDDYLFAYALEQENQKYQRVHLPVKPDVTIEHLRELLDIFVGAV